MVKKKLSFVIPVYNVEKYLKECIDSILNQYDETCEIILVDDESTDSSGSICDEYKERINDIKVIHTKNGGPAMARNIGLCHAIGEYIFFVDSDDRVSNGAVKQILTWIDAENSDICFMDAIKFYPDGMEESLGDNIEHKFVYQKGKNEVIKYISTRPKFSGSACTKLFKRQFLIKNNLKFPIDRIAAEDLTFCLNALLCAETFDALGFSCYQYRQNREGSTTNSFPERQFWDLAKFIRDSVDKLIKENSTISFLLMSNVAYEYTILCWKVSFLEKSRKKEAYKFLKQYKYVLKYGLTPRLKAIYYFCKLFGVVLTSKALYMYKKV